MKVKVVLNEQHTLLEQQRRVLEEYFGEDFELELVPIPAKGLTCEEQVDLAYRLARQAQNWGTIVVASPVPVLLAKLGLLRAIRQFTLYVLANDRREKVEQNGKVFYKIPADGWRLWAI